MKHVTLLYRPRLNQSLSPVLVLKRLESRQSRRDSFLARSSWGAPWGRMSTWRWDSSCPQGHSYRPGPRGKTQTCHSSCTPRHLKLLRLNFVNNGMMALCSISQLWHSQCLEMAQSSRSIQIQLFSPFSNTIAVQDFNLDSIFGESSEKYFNNGLWGAFPMGEKFCKNLPSRKKKYTKSSSSKDPTKLGLLRYVESNCGVLRGSRYMIGSTP